MPVSDPEESARRRRRLGRRLFALATLSFLFLVLAMTLLPGWMAGNSVQPGATPAMLLALLEFALVIGATALYTGAANALEEEADREASS